MSSEIATPKRTSQGIREVLFEELHLLRTGKSNPTRANAVGRLAGAILESVNLEISAHRLIQQGASGLVALPKPIDL